VHEPSRPTRLSVAFDAVLRAAQANAGWAFKLLHDAFAPGVASYVRSQGASDAEGMTNEILFAAFRSLGRFRGDEGRFQSWLFTIAHNRVIDERRRRSREVPRIIGISPEDVMVSGGNAEDEAVARIAEHEMRALLDRLTPDQRNVLLLRIVGDLTVAQVSAVLDKPPSAVKALQRRALAALHRQLLLQGVSL
jgi:RNA polymerase sigma factor (sigma-70 family)